VHIDAHYLLQRRVSFPGLVILTTTALIEVAKSEDFGPNEIAP